MQTNLSKIFDTKNHIRLSDFSGMPQPESEPDEFDGTYKRSNGGTETVFRRLINFLPKEILVKNQIICSRVRKLSPNKNHILYLHDWWEDPENDHLKNPQNHTNFDKFVFVSDYQFNTYQQAFKLSYDKSFIIRNSIEPFDIDKCAKKYDDTETIRLIYHTTPHRGLDLLIPTFVELCKTHKNLHLDVFSSFSIYGWGQRDSTYSSVFDVCKNHPNITYHGAQPNHVVREYLERAHIFAYPNIWPETSCIAAIEALASGCWVIAPNYGALPETIGLYGTIYKWSETPLIHVNRFARILNQVILEYKSNFSELKNSMMYNNNLYNWENRKQDWLNILT